MLVNLRNLAPPSLCGPALVDDVGLPRYWAAVWALFLPADLASSTVRKKLSHLDSFYRHSDALLGVGGLDNALADLDVEALSDALEGYFFSIRNSSSITPASEERWQAAVQFVTEISQRVTRDYLRPESLNELRGKFDRLELLHSHLHIGKRRRLSRFARYLLTSSNSCMSFWTRSPLSTHFRMRVLDGAYTSSSSFCSIRDCAVANSLCCLPTWSRVVSTAIFSMTGTGCLSNITSTRMIHGTPNLASRMRLRSVRSQ